MKTEPLHPVFHDPKGRRRLVVYIFSALLGTGLLIQIALLVWSLVDHPSLPPVALSATLPSPAEPAQPAPLPPGPAGCRLLEPSEADRPAPPTPQNRCLSFAFMVSGDEAGFDSFRQHVNDLDVLIPQWLYYSPDNGMLIEDDPARREAVVALANGSQSHLRIMPLVTNLINGNWDQKHFVGMLAEADLRKLMIEQLIAYAQANAFMGISVDFERLPKRSLPHYYAFLEGLAGRLHSAGLKLSVNVPSEDEQQDYPRIAAAADYVILMAYDEHWTGEEAGPIAGSDWLGRIIPKLRQSVPAEKLVLALGNYAYDWPQEGPGVPRSVEEALSTARNAAANITFDSSSLNPTYEYLASDGKYHRVWFLDAVTAYNAMVTSASARPAGLALWRLGMEDPSIWTFFGRNVAPSPEVASGLSQLNPQWVLYQGNGEILRLSSPEQKGLRRLWYDGSNGLIRQEQYAILPSPATITQYGQNPRQIALTFDDGPDVTYTPEVLSVLRRENVKATFFVVGQNCQWHPDLLREEVAQGHEIGVHTFTHPDISKISPRELEMELSACQRTLEVAAGCHSTLFRPPYGQDVHPTSREHLRSVEQVSRLGYLTVGMRIDTADWTNPGVEDIVSSALEQASDGGRIIVMHDSGGDRRQTVEALPKIIAEFRKRGYEFVTVSQMLGQTREQVMPPLAAAETIRAGSNRVAFAELRWIQQFVEWVFIIGLLLGLIRMALIACGAVIHRHRAWKNGKRPAPDLSLSVIVPAHNEEKVVVRTVRSLLASEGVPDFEILVVDDGSTDGTHDRVASTFAGEPRVKVYTKPNGGKSSALNFGLQQTASDVVIMLDADTLFQSDTIRRLLAHFADPKVGAVAGNVKVGNRINLLTRWQALEYVTSQSLDRRALTMVNCSTVVPGAVGAWRRDLVVRAGLLNHRTLAEDADLTVTICRMGYTIEYDDAAIAWTEAPDVIGTFLRQRFRWMFGTFQVAAKHIAALFNGGCPRFGFIGMPNLLVFQVFYPLIAPLMDLAMLCSIFLALYALGHNAAGSAAAERRFALYYGLFLSVDMMSAVLAFRLERGEDYKLILWVPVQRIFYRFVLYYIALKSAMNALTGKAVGWGIMPRKATVAAVDTARETQPAA